MSTQLLTSEILKNGFIHCVILIAVYSEQADSSNWMPDGFRRLYELSEKAVQEIERVEVYNVEHQLDPVVSCENKEV